jgi:hypothetical protein
MTILDAAEVIPTYIQAGLPVMPLHSARDGICTCGRLDCHSPGKHPILGLAHRKDDPLRATCHGECGRLGHGLYDATTDATTVAIWLAKWPWCNWGVRPPVGVVILDVDPRNGGATALQELTGRHGELPPTLTARTGSGGLHIWLSYNGPTRGKLCTGVDVKSNTGYVVAPPSVHACGGTYEWINQQGAAYAPQWVKDILNPPIRHYPTSGGRGANVTNLIQFVAESGEGERNRRLYWAACRAHEAGMDPTPLVDAACSVGLTTSAALATVRSAANAAPRHGKKAG